MIILIPTNTRLKNVFFETKLWGLWSKVMSWALGPSEDTNSSEETTWLKRSMLSLSLETKKKGPRSNFSSNTKNPEQMYVQATEAHPLSTWKGRKYKISKQKLPPPHWMHYSYFSGRINVEKTLEQCYLGYHNSQRTERGVWWDGCSSRGLDYQQV